LQDPAFTTLTGSGTFDSSGKLVYARVEDPPPQLQITAVSRRRSEHEHQLETFNSASPRGKQYAQSSSISAGGTSKTGSPAAQLVRGRTLRWRPDPGAVFKRTAGRWSASWPMDTIRNPNLDRGREQQLPTRRPLSAHGSSGSARQRWPGSRLKKAARWRLPPWTSPREFTS